MRAVGDRAIGKWEIATRRRFPALPAGESVD